jgi:glycerol-3-phosphate dehydrogenase
MALSLEDVVMRRTCIGGLGPPPPEALDRAARIIADECSWDEKRRQNEMLSVMRNFRTRGDA